MGIEDDVNKYLSFAEPPYERAAVELGPDVLPVLRGVFESTSHSDDASKVLLARRAVYFAGVTASKFPPAVDPALRLVAEALGNDNYRVRLAGAAAAAEIGGPSRIEALITCLGDPHPAVQAWAIGQIALPRDDQFATIRATEGALRAIADGQDDELATAARDLLNPPG